MRIVIDMDGVICEETKPYKKAKPIVGVQEKINHWMLYMGYTIVIHTSRRERDRKLTVNWLKEHGVLYDKLIMGKPKGDMYIDDKAIRFTGNWSFLP